MSDNRISRALSRILRHSAVEDGLSISSDGWVLVADLCRFLKTTPDVVERIVTTNDKQRFQMDSARKHMRAVQGHTMEQITEEGLMEKLTLQTAPLVAHHGTYLSVLEAIRQTGLSRMSRKHIHLATAIDSSRVLSGMRRSCEVVITINVHQAIRDGFVFYRSANGVILTPGDAQGKIPTSYFVNVQILSR